MIAAVAIMLVAGGIYLTHKPGELEILKPGSIFTDCPDCPQMVVIAAGSFDMGSPASEAGRSENEGPLHRITIDRTFALGKTEVTRKMFAVFVRETGYDAGNKCYTFEKNGWSERSGRNWRNPGYAQDDNHPVACINWSDARAYTEWLARRTGKPYRLPSEAEWEYAARGNTKTARYWGESAEQACAYANVMDTFGKSRVVGVSWETHKCDDGYAFTSPVGNFKANAFGFDDMIGNVWEWVEDSFHYNYNGAPVDGSAWKDGSIGHILRGGSWGNEPPGARAAYRNYVPGLRDFYSGFRVAMMLR